MHIYGVFNLENERVKYFTSYDEALVAFERTNGSTGVVLFVAGQPRTQVLNRK